MLLQPLPPSRLTMNRSQRKAGAISAVRIALSQQGWNINHPRIDTCIGHLAAALAHHDPRNAEAWERFMHHD